MRSSICSDRLPSAAAPPSAWRAALRLAAALVLVVTGAAGCADDAVPLPPLAYDATVLAFGDSLTFGTGAPPESNYPSALSGLIGRQVVASGVPGEVSADGLRRLPGVLEKHQPALVILCHGGNDMLRKQDLGAAENNLREMVALSRAAGAAVVLVGVPKPSLVLSTAEHYDRVAESLGLPYLRDTVAEVLSDRSLKHDAAHPNAAGYRRIADELAALLREAGAVP